MNSLAADDVSKEVSHKKIVKTSSWNEKSSGKLNLNLFVDCELKTSCGQEADSCDEVSGIPQHRRFSYHGGYDNPAFQGDSGIPDSTASSYCCPSPSSSISCDSTWDQKETSHGETDTGISMNDSDESSIMASTVRDAQEAPRLSIASSQHDDLIRNVATNRNNNQEDMDILEKNPQPIVTEVSQDLSSCRGECILYHGKICDTSRNCHAENVTRRNSAPTRGTRREYKRNLRHQLWMKRNANSVKHFMSVHKTDPNLSDTTALRNKTVTSSGRSDYSHCKFRQSDTAQESSDCDELTTTCLRLHQTPHCNCYTSLQCNSSYSKETENQSSMRSHRQQSPLSKDTGVKFSHNKIDSSSSHSIQKFSTEICSRHHPPVSCYSRRDKSCPPFRIKNASPTPYQRLYQRARSAPPNRQRPASPFKATTAR